MDLGNAHYLALLKGLVCEHDHSNLALHFKRFVAVAFHSYSVSHDLLLVMIEP